MKDQNRKAMFAKRKVTVDDFHKMTKDLGKKGLIRNGMTLSQIVEIHNKKTGDKLFVGKRNGDLNPNFKFFKNDADRIKANKKKFADQKESVKKAIAGRGFDTSRINISVVNPKDIGA